MKLYRPELVERVFDLKEEVRLYGSMPVCSFGLQDKVEFELMHKLLHYSREARLDHKPKLEEELRSVKGLYGLYLAQKYLKEEDVTFEICLGRLTEGDSNE